MVLEKKNNCFDQRSFMRVFCDASFCEVKNWLYIKNFRWIKLWKYTFTRYSNLLIVDERLTTQGDYYRLVKKCLSWTIISVNNLKLIDLSYMIREGYIILINL